MSDLIPVSRKEQYLSKIDGMTNKSPDKTYTKEEYFFSEILGEALHKPVLETRYEMYLAKIAGREIGIPYPETRLERFLAKAAGMDITVPVPITREEIFWSNYSAIVDFEVEGVPPLVYKAIEGTLENYRIYGNTVNGESVGDLITEGEHAGEYSVPVTVTNGTDTETTNLYLPEQIKMVGDEAEYVDYKEQKQHRVRKNLVQTIATSQTINDITFTVNANGSVTCNGTNHGNNPIMFELNNPDVVFPEGVYITSGCPAGGSITGGYKIQYFNGSGWNYELGSGSTFTLSGNLKYRSRILISKDVTVTNLTFYPMLRLASIEDDTYEPYIEDTELDVTLPALPTLSGTNILTVGTEVQPSGVEIKGRIQEVTEKTFEVNFYNGDTLLETAQNVAYNGTATYTGSTPTKASTAQYDYTFAGWTKTQGGTTVDADALTGVTADRNVYAVFTATARSYTVTFMNVSTLMDTQTVTYGGTAVYGGTTPTKAETSEYTYTFAGWNTNSSASTADADALTNVTADRTVYAIFTAVPKGYTVYFYNGETLLETVTGVPSGGTATYTGATPTKSGYVFTGWSPSPTNIQADTACYAQFKEDEMYESITDTWSQIIANVSNGTYSTKYQVGDTKKIDLGTEGEVIMTIVGIDTDDLADNSGKAPITWISKQLLKTKHKMNPPNQSGASGTGTLGGWEACEMRSYLINTIKPLLPSEVRNALKTVKKYSRIYNTSETALNNIVSNDDIWIPSAYEVNLSDYETSGVTYSSTFPDNASRIKHTVDGSAAEAWWLRSAYNTYSFERVHYNGSGGHVNAVSTYGVAVGFVI